jgi:carbon-monoxide dehydrogenase small subunit
MNEPKDKIDLIISVNGIEHKHTVPARQNLADFLRSTLGLTGTHVGCEHGVCGSCTVLLNGVMARSCLILAAQANGASVDTIEGLARNGKLHPLQEAFKTSHALQCGFCTPGFLMSSVALLNQQSDPTEKDVREWLSGNLCRCTGYQFIVEAVLSAAAEMRSSSLKTT